MGQDGAPHWRRNLAAVTVATFIGFTGFTLVMPFLPLYLEQLGVTSTGEIAVWAGAALGITPAITALMAPVWARVADRYGRKLMVARSLFSFVVIMAALAFVTAPWQVVALRGVQGFFAGYGMLALTMAAESAPEGQMARAIGWVQTAQRLGPAIGPLVGGALAEMLGLRNAFLVAAGMFLCGMALVVVGYREDASARRADQERPRPTVTFRSLLAVPHFTLMLGAIFALQMVDRSFGPVLPLYLREIGAASDRITLLAGAIFTAAAGAATVGNQVCHRLLRRYPAPFIVAGGATAAAGAACAFAVGPGPSWLIAAALVFGLSLGLAFTTMYTLAGQRVSPDARGVAFGYLTTASLAGLAISPVTAGLIGATSMRGVFVADAVGLGALAWWVHRRMTREPRA